MNRKRLVLAVLLSGFLSTVSSTAAPQLLINPGFEEGANVEPWNDTVPPTGWNKSVNGGWAGWKNNHPAHSGTKYVDAGAINYGESGIWYQDIGAAVGESYLCSVWAMTEGWETDPHASMSLEFRDVSGKTLSTNKLNIFTGTPPSPNVWTRYALITWHAPVGTAYARFMLRGEARCTAMFDDAAVFAASAKIKTDFNDDGVTNFLDFAEIAQLWLSNCNSSQLAIYDLDDSGTIDAGDLEFFASDWLRYDSYVTIDISEDVKYQQMDGFGASITESSAWLLCNALTAQERHELMIALFDPNIGIGLSFLRQPMGSCDFRLADYTYDDIPPGQTDYGLVHFSIAHDKTYIIPLLKEALAISPDIKIMGSPWSAPAWMKDSENLSYGRLIDSDQIYNTYAEYFVRYIQAYAAEGLAIGAITLQNEPHYEPYSYPGMRMEPPDQARLAICLGQKLLANNIVTKILIWDHNWDTPAYPITVLNNAVAKPYIAGTAFHGYAGDVSAQMQVVAAHPDKDIYFTECSGGDWSVDFGNNLVWDTSTLIIKAVRYRAKTVVKWNLALDENHGPKISGGCSNCRGVVTINQSTGRITREVEYYSLGHAAKFVRPGAKRIFSTEELGQSIENVAFVNQDGSVVVIALNRNRFRQNVRFRWKGRSFIYGLPARSVTTFKWLGQPGAGVEVWVTTADRIKLLERQQPVGFY